MVKLGEGLPHGPPAPPLLDPAGPRIELGGADPLVGPVMPAADTMFGPRGAWSFPDGTLWVADTGHHRLLGWARPPERDGQPADWVLGQPGFDREGRNALGSASALTMNVPCGVAPYGERGMAVADAWNHRVLVWREVPRESHVPADFVLGQVDFAGQSPNRADDVQGGERAAADTLHWPFQVLVHGGRLYVADGGNRRVLVWRELPDDSGVPADFALGQPDRTSRSDNAGGAPNAATMRWPHDLAVHDGDLVVTDAGNNRVMIWDGRPDDDGVPCARVLGQTDFESVDHNRSSYWPDARCLNMPYGVSVTPDGVLAVADTANSRLVGFRSTATGAEAVLMTGQDNFAAKGDNRWQAQTRDSLCWPYGLRFVGGRAIVCDTGNHRVLLWQ